MSEDGRGRRANAGSGERSYNDVGRQATEGYQRSGNSLITVS